MTNPTWPTAAELDRDDLLAGFRDRFIAADDEGIVYVDGNSLGRPPKVLKQEMSQFIENKWGTRLIRGWDEEWMNAPLQLGDRLGRTVLGADPGQTVVADSTTVNLYKLLRAALRARADRNQIVVDRGNFPTDRYLVEGIAAETGCELVWLDPDPALGVTPEDVQAVVGEATAVVLLSHVAYRSSYVSDVPAITDVVHRAGGLVVWDLCHSIGSYPIELDAWGVDYAAGCTYKYLNGGPGAPAMLYVRKDLQAAGQQPITGWMGAGDSFEMGQGYVPAQGIRRFISGTPPILAMMPMRATLDMIEEVGIGAVRRKAVALTEFAISLFDRHLAPLGVTLSSPRDSSLRGGHITVDHPAFADLVIELWDQGVIPDFRPPTGLRLGLSPLSTSFAEVETAVLAIVAGLRDAASPPA